MDGGRGRGSKVHSSQLTSEQADAEADAAAGAEADAGAELAEVPSLQDGKLPERPALSAPSILTPQTSVLHHHFVFLFLRSPPFSGRCPPRKGRSTTGSPPVQRQYAAFSNGGRGRLVEDDAYNWASDGMGRFPMGVTFLGLDRSGAFCLETKPDEKQARSNRFRSLCQTDEHLVVSAHRICV